jgi:hypothetical protein
MKVFITSIPKSGTHLLASVLQHLQGEYPTSLKKKRDPAESYSEYEKFDGLVGHIRANHLAENESLSTLFTTRKILILVRDPRAICNSMVHYLLSSTNANHLLVRDQIASLSYAEQVIAVSKGLRSPDRKFMVPELAKMCTGFVEIQQSHTDSFLFRYEDLLDVEPASQELANVLGTDPQRTLDSLTAAIAGPSRTKREGRPDGWRDAFNGELADYFRASYSGLIKDLGYEL